eukprot:TRINITY_DN3055_c0_g2_i1.p1 TRINITY_DN3055_c0_g2~~TRINITY_DN3055_c0_g2_i1.p1  ORF type:complete len:228 (-),score=81.80 TRINITY_DN3055_c0_g2_i1:193-777(-)
MVPVHDLEAVFRRHASARESGSSLDVRAFNDALSELEPLGLHRIANTPLAEQLFRVFDKDHSGAIDLEEFVVGAALLANGSNDEKAEVTFRAFDSNGNGFVEESELSTMIQSSYDAAVKMALSIADLSQLDEATASVVSAVREHTAELAREVFHRLDANHDGRLDLAEFKQLCSSVEDISATVNGLVGKISIVV